MAFKNFSFGLREKCCRARTQLGCRGGLLFFLAFEFGLLALPWGSPSLQDWNLVLGSLDFLSSVTILGVVLFSLLYLGFRVWRLSRRFGEIEEILALSQKASADRRRSGFGFNGLVCVSCGSKVRPWKCCLSERSPGSKDPVVERMCSPKWGDKSCIGRKEEKDLSDDFEEEEKDEDDEEEEGSGGDDIMRLREEIEKETRLRVRAVRDLEEERSAAASAAEEATAKMLRLQTERAFVEREARRYREIAEQKKAYDRHYIEQLQWLIEKLETEKGETEGRFE